MFENSLPTFAWVELRRKGVTTSTKYYQEVEGQHQIYDIIQAPSVSLPLQNFVIRINGLENKTTYEYRVCAQKIDEMKPYSAKISTQYESDWYEFTTLDASAEEHHLLVLSDMHNNSAKLESFLKALNYGTADHIIYAGDMMDNMQVGKPSATALASEEPYASFINTSAQLFATRQDFCMLRGDHETKGDAAEYFGAYFPYQSGRYYNAYRWGDLEVVMLDGGEAMPDDDPTVYNNMLAAYNPYRQEEARWLEQLIQTPDFQTARYRIVISHLPIPCTSEDATQAGAKYFSDLMTPILNGGNIDLLVCGHLHPETYVFQEPAEGVAFPTLVQGYNSALRIDVVDGKVALRIVDASGNTLFYKVL
ncbi:MAG: metallophosphoesterase [Bacteroidaceae bacterium]|nr:metallophosphoesterase [Bacteroidaceae bacterium]